MKNIMKHAQKLQSKMLDLQNELSNKTIESSVGGGVVKVLVNGSQRLVSIKIEEEIINSKDIEMLQDLILVAVNDALNKSQEMVSNEMGKLTGGLKIPGIM